MDRGRVQGKEGEPLVSVVLPTRDRAALLPRALESVMGQTLSDWECLVIDDASSDETPRLMERLTARDPRIRYLPLERRRGAAGARNHGIRHSRGRYVALLDSDDEWMAEKLALQAAALEEGDDRLGGVTCGVRFVSLSGRERDRCPSARAEIQGEILARNPVGSPSRVMVRRACFERVGTFDEDFPAYGDRDMWVRIARRYRWGRVPRILVRYHETEGALSADAEKVITGARRLWNKHELASSPPGIRAEFLVRLGHRLADRCLERSGGRYMLRAWRQAPWRLHLLGAALLAGGSPPAYRSLVRVFQGCRDRLDSFRRGAER